MMKLNMRRRYLPKEKQRNHLLENDSFLLDELNMISYANQVENIRDDKISRKFILYKLNQIIFKISKSNMF